MKQNSATYVEEYYKAGLKQNFTEMAKFLHPEVQFSAPLAQLNGREAVVEAAKGFFGFLKSIDFRSSFSSDNEAMLIYDAFFPEPIGRFPAALFVTFEDGLMRKMELFYDPRPLLANR